MKKSMLTFSLLFFVSSNVFGQAPDTLWTKAFGGSDRDGGYSVQQTTGSGFIIVGDTKSFGAGNYDVWFIRTDTNGDTIWTKTLGGGDSDRAFGLQLTSDGGFIVLGETRSFGAGDYDVWLIRTNGNADTVWTKTFGGTMSDVGFSVQETSDGGYIIAGWTESFGAGGSDVWLIRTDADGNTLWTKTFGGSKSDAGISVREILDGGYIIAGWTESFGAGGFDAWLIRTDAEGNSIWAKTFGGSDYDGSYSVQQTSDGGYIIAGDTKSYGEGEVDAWLIKTNSIGDTIWTKTFGGSSYDYVSSFQQTTDGGYIILGFTYSFGAGGSDFWLIRTDADGDSLWTKTFGGNDDDDAHYVQQTSDGGFVLVGSTSSFGSGERDVWLIRVAPESWTSVNNNRTKNVSDYMLRQNYPNPFNPFTTISYQLPKSSMVNLSIYDTNGRLVETLINENKTAGYYSVEWNAENVSSGVYFYRIVTKEYSQVRKCIVLK